ncbi:hypothetical protein [Flavobacterium sp.]|uniref:hypothetical protein n=1 Tax=Flavobacterium sp. TaxID=239 RepID=UPI0025C456CB|nr:hypothetical protein [Flavobacterium sp.]
MEEEKSIWQIEIPKNKWLYTNDSFGKLEKDMVFESKTYSSGIREPKTENFKIVTKRLKKKR